jgi:uncharacterized membrane protein YecN with MAPEG domain
MPASQRARLVVGLVSTVVATALAVLIWGRLALAGAATFGLVATGVQVLAARVMARTGVTPSLDHLKVYGLGVLFRWTGVLILGVTVALDRTTFAPLASATGYLGTVLPLLYLETRLSR